VAGEESDGTVQAGWLAGLAGAEIDFQEKADRLRAAATGANGLKSVSVSADELPVAGMRLVTAGQSGPGIEGPDCPVPGK